MKETEQQEETDSRGRGTDSVKVCARVGMVSMGDRWLTCTIDEWTAILCGCHPDNLSWM